MATTTTTTTAPQTATAPGGPAFPPNGTKTTTGTTDPAVRHRRPWHIPLVYCLLLLFSIIELGLSARVVHLINNDEIRFVDSVSARFKFVLFCAIWTILVSVALLALSMVTFFLRWFHHIGVLALTSFFWLIAAALIEAKVGDFNDADNICSLFLGSGTCSVIKAVRAFAWLLWITTLVGIPLVWFFRHVERQDRRHRSDPMRQTTTATPATRTV